MKKMVSMLLIMCKEIDETQLNSIFNILNKLNICIINRLLMGKKLQQPKLKLESNGKHLKLPTTSKMKQQPQQQTPPSQKSKPVRHSRLIIRNLVFDINEKHLRKLMGMYGEVREISIPVHPDRNTSKGFAFVEMANRNECGRAIEALNGTKYKGRTIVLDMAVSKENFMTDKLNEMGHNQEVKMEDSDDNREDQSQQMQNQQSNDRQCKKQELKREENEQSQQNMIKQQYEQQGNEQQMEQQRLREQKQDRRHEIFIRNIPISITQKDLYAHFIRYGPISFVRLVINKETHLSKGTAFIKYHNADVSQRLIKYSREYEANLRKHISNWVANPNINLQLDGSIVKIFPVESRAEISEKLRIRQGEPKKKRPLKITKLQDLVEMDIHGKRRLELALVGRWKAEEGMNKYDYQMFKDHEREKVDKLKNPNLSISERRVILKHLDMNVNEETLKQVAMNFLRERNSNKGCLVYCKLMLDRKMKKSVGYAFIEFNGHEIAKNFIEYVVNNSQILQNKLFIVQFAMQNSQTMLKIKKKFNHSVKKSQENRTNINNESKNHNNQKNKEKKIKKDMKSAYRYKRVSNKHLQYH